MPGFSSHPRKVSTNIQNTGSKAGSYHVADVVNASHMSEHLPYSPARNTLNEDGFMQGHAWTTAPGRVQEHFGKVNI